MANSFVNLLFSVGMGLCATDLDKKGVNQYLYHGQEYGLVKLAEGHEWKSFCEGTEQKIGTVGPT